MADYINNVAAGDLYTPECTLGPDFAMRTAIITIANNPALLQFALGVPGNWHWTDEREFFSIPQSFKVGGVIGLKVRNANPGQVARVLAVLSGPDDVDFEAGLPFGGSLSASGTITPPVGPGEVNVFFDQLLAAPGNFDTGDVILPGSRALLCTLYGRMNVVGGAFAASVAFNGDFGANYDETSVQSSAAGVVVGAGGAGHTSIDSLAFPGTAALAGAFGVAEFVIPAYDNPVGWKALSGTNEFSDGASFYARTFTGLWQNVAPITRIQAIASTGLWVAGSRFTVTGL